MCMISSRFNKHQVRTLSFLSPRLDFSSVCPACPKVQSWVHVCVYLYDVKNDKVDLTHKLK